MQTRPDSPPVTLEDLKRLGIDLESFSSKLIAHRSRQPEDPLRPGSKSKPMLEVLDRLVRSAAVDLSVKFGSFRVLSEICLAHGLAPEAYMLSDTTDFKIDRASFRSSDFAPPGEGRTGDSFCVKLLRIYSRSQRKLIATRQRFYHESARWKLISHSYLTPVLEVSDLSVQGRITFSVITPWASNGNITQYLQNHPKADRLKLLTHVACGLEHLHTLGIIHSSINPGNILVNEDGQAILVDFGVNQIISHHTMSGPERTMSSKPNARRYMPPELLDSENDRCSHSEAGDIYSLAMTAFEVLTGIVPYGDFREDTIPWRIINDERPVRPTDSTHTLRLPDPLWEMLEDCWNKEPELRWEARCVRHRFSNPTTARVQGMPCLGGVALRPTGFSVKRDQLQADDCPKYLAKCLEYELEKRPIQREHVSETQPDEDKGLVEVFDKVLRHRPFDPLISKQFRQLCDREDLVPTSYAIPGKQISIVGECAIASGGFGDVWKGIYNGREVAIKALRVYKNEGKRKVSRVFYKEITIWKRLSHPNIVPFLGVVDGPAPLSMVLEWMPNGDVRHYVKNHLEVDRLQLLLDICNGLQALHDHDVIHGDLKSANILINSLGWACLTDFGLASIVSFNYAESSTHGRAGSWRWMAPELMHLTMDQHNRPTKQSDIYAFAMVAIEVFTGLVPFPSCQQDPIVMFKVTEGGRPLRPTEATNLGLTDDLWKLIQSAWAQEVELRPPVEAIISFLLRAS